MVTTRSQEAAASGNANGVVGKPQTKVGKRTTKKQSQESLKKKVDEAEEKEKQYEVEVGTKRGVEEAKEEEEETKGGGEEEPPTKKVRLHDEDEDDNATSAKSKEDHPAQHLCQSGTIERGHVYFFYRPRVELEEVHSVDDVQRFHILLVPRPPEFSTESQGRKSDGDEEEMNVISAGADAVPAPATSGQKKKPFRLIAVGKKSLPDPEVGGGGRKAIFWATIVTVGDDLQKLQDGLGAKEYETKTRGTRHQGPARIAARGAYAIVNNDAQTPSKRETHFGYHLSHPTGENFGEVQEALGIHPASSFVIQVKNPEAPNTGPAQGGMSRGRRAEFPGAIMKEVFGTGGGRGRESYGLRFASVERREMLDYE